MARDGSGTYTNPYPNFVSGTVISSTETDTNNSQSATALTQSIAVDGQSVVTADLPLATHKFTGMKVGTAATDSLSLGQAQAEAFVWCGTATGSADAIVLTPSPPITAYAAGQRFVWMASSITNTDATTVAISGLSAIALQDNGAALTAGQHAASKMFMGILNTTSTVQVMQVQISGTDPLIVSSLTVTGDATIGDDLTLLSDASVLGFGVDTDVKITHVHDSGLEFKNTSTDDDTPFVLLIQTGETIITGSDVLGKIQFQAPDESSGTDAILVAAEIAAVAESAFSASSNATKLSFKTGASEIAAEKMSLSSGGNLSLTTDAAVVDFGVDSDVTLTHMHDIGLSLSAGANRTQLEVISTDDGTSKGPTLELTRDSATPAASDSLGNIKFIGKNLVDENVIYAEITTLLLDPTDGAEDGQLDIEVMRAGALVSAIALKENEIELNATTIDVNGAVNFSDDVTYAAGADIITASLGANNVRIGDGAGDSIEVGGDANVVVGTDAGTSITTGSYNTAVGHNALDANTTGDYNTVSGGRAFRSNTTGSRNIAVGYTALDANTTADNNTAVGYSALNANTTGTNNIAVGSYTLDANTTADNNTGVGYSALSANTTGEGNVAVGYLALDANTTANNNTAVGNAALTANTTATNNTAMGYNALTANTTGASNIAVGNAALAANTTANNNVAMGHNALGANTTGTANTALGRNALTLSTTADSNTAVGYLALSSTSTGNKNVAVGDSAGYGTDTAEKLTEGTGNVFLGFEACGTVADQDYGTALGFDVTGAGGYTTIGKSGSDIRALHGTATWATVSDERYKKDIVDSTAGLAFVNALRPRTFKYRTLGELPETFRAYESGSTEVFKNSDTNHGFIAQEVKAAIDADSSIKDGFRLWDDREDGSQEVAEAALIPVLTRAIQELSAQVTALTARLAILEG